MAKYALLRVALIFIFLVTHGFAEDLSFPTDFLFGAATSSYQIEGAWNEDGKGENVWDRWTHEHPELVRDGTNGNVACDSYHKYKEDIQLLKDIGVHFYRFSLSWSRILPTGYANVVNKKGLNYYKNLIKELLENDIQPFVTLYHWDHPQIFEDMGGWTNEMMVEWISDYARVVFKELGPKVKYFTTINEPSVICTEAYAGNALAPGKNLGDYGKYLCMHNILKAHAKIYHIYDEEFREQQNGQISLVISCAGAFAKNPNDNAAIDIYFQFTCGWLAHPIFSNTGDYPQIMKTRIAENSELDGFPRSLLPQFSPQWVQYIRGTADYLALNHYTSRNVEIVPRKAGQKWYDYSGVKDSIDPSWPEAASDWLRVVPAGLRQTIEKVTEEYNHPPIFITENGYSDKCCIADYLRISYMYSYMQEMLAAINESSCNVKGYITWSLLDNFEWKAGYTEKFGMISVNFADPNRTRTPKLSMSWYKDVIHNHELHPILNFPTIINTP